MIIGISGQKGSGKTTVANYLQRRIDGAMILPFAFKVKQIAQECYGATAIQVDGTEVQKNTVTQCGQTGRQLMQNIGTAMRSIWPSVFVHAWDHEVLKIWAECGVSPVIVPDVRFVNEVEKIKAWGGIVIRLKRRPFRDNHESETALMTYKKFDLCVDNTDQTEAETCNEVLAYCQEKGIV